MGLGVLRKEFDYSGSGRKAVGYIVVREVKEILVRGPSVGLSDAVVRFNGANPNGVFKKGKFWWVRKEMSVEKVFGLVKKVEGEMGAEIAISY